MPTAAPYDDIADWYETVSLAAQLLGPGRGRCDPITPSLAAARDC